MAKIIGAQPLYGYEDGTQIYVPGRRPLNIAVIGGGHGLSTMLRGLKAFTRHITAIVTVADDGGGSGTLRQELGMLPPGDIRNCIQALSNVEPLMAQLLDYRFTDGSLRGQSFGNLFLAALTGRSDRFDQAVSRMCQVLNVTGRVMPVTCDNVQLEAVLSCGRRVLGESRIHDAIAETRSRIQQVRLLPEHPAALPQALDAIAQADLIVLGPGSLYTSLIPNLLVDGVAEALAASPARKVLVMNIMTEEGETEGYTGLDHVSELLRYAPGAIDVCLSNSAPIDEDVLEAYRREDSEPIRLCADEIEALGIETVQLPLIAHSRYARHDPEKLAEAVLEIHDRLRPAGRR